MRGAHASPFTHSLTSDPREACLQALPWPHIPGPGWGDQEPHLGAKMGVVPRGGEAQRLEGCPPPAMLSLSLPTQLFVLEAPTLGPTVWPRLESEDFQPQGCCLPALL